MSEIKEEDVENYLRQYVPALERLLEHKYPRAKEIGLTSGFPLEFPVEVTAYIVPRGIHVKYQKSDAFEIKVLKMEEAPKKSGLIGEFIPAYRFLVIKDRGEERAESDIVWLLSLPEQYEAMQREMELMDEKLWQDEMKYVVESYKHYLDVSKNVCKKTIVKRTQELYDSVTRIQNHVQRLELLYQIGCEVLAETHFLINEDMESSLFLALNGKYYVAMALLRKILEVNVKAMYFDSLPQKHKQNLQEKIKLWLNGRNPRLPSVQKMLGKLIDKRTDERIVQFLRHFRRFSGSSFRKYVQDLYHELCLYVHLCPEMSLDEKLKMSFSEYDEERFTLWYTCFEKVNEILDTLLVLKFPSILVFSEKEGFPKFLQVEIEALSKK